MSDIVPLYESNAARTSTSGYVPPQVATTQTGVARKQLEFNPPKFAAVHPIESGSAYESMMTAIGNFCGAFGQIPGCFCCPNPFKEVKQGNIGLVSRFGRYYRTSDPGLVKVNPLTEKVFRVDTKIQIAALGKLPIVTKDNVSVEIEAVLYWHIIDPYLAIYGVSDVKQALTERTQTTLRAVLGGRDLQDLIENRDTIASAITDIIDQPAHAWGVTVESILIKDIHMSHELQVTLSAAATQKRIGQSKVIQAQAEVDAAMLMREAAEILNTPAAMQIRTLDSMVMMAKAANTKVLFVPVNQDYSNGSINAFGGAGATVGVNAYGSGGAPGTSESVAHVEQSADDRRSAVQFQLKDGSKPGYSESSPIHSSVKDAALYSQIMEM
ncbi:hypothetical protein GGI03_005924 [Coemansia sp. RSA 2337]|nr:hypothetical protein GGI14_002577 [Coemansia sp. S680]KAJ2032646.1 hypothetical protein H4S03_006154 [Coemansia sp. S3946]KAJ2040252.1 hypothetical protein H4S04_007949 [Coemansia sp. S16]KAJ2099292.1 hypothetical protein GGI09_002860 [Coemansia sp. S100]KAJ2100348.1 hypothetical protein IW146_009576 [Coemansia sp. RSA 922]KAJ2458046.1 hypothetical protein GGI03_005924 [Coemansia sp. RSA 2337]